jgi:hypothetical protein
MKIVYRGKNILLHCHLSKVIKIACYSCQILKLFLIIVFLITLGIINKQLTLKVCILELILPKITQPNFLYQINFPIFT